MPSLSIRNLPEPVQTALKAEAAAAGLSAEAYVRRALEEAVRKKPGGVDMPVNGFAEVSTAYTVAPTLASTPAPAELWGALRGSVQVAPGTELSAPTGEEWAALG